VVNCITRWKPPVARKRLSVRLRLHSSPRHFSSLSFGGAAVKNPRVVVVQDALNKAGGRSRSTGNRPYDPRPKISRLLLGMNVLKHLHINIAPKTGKLYVSAASPPPASK